MRSSIVLLSLAIASAGAASLLASCGDTPAQPQPDASTPDAADEPAPPLPSAACQALSLPARPWSAGPYGAHRGEIADDFSVPLVDGTTWSLRQQWSGCETYLVVPDGLVVSELDPTPVWEKDLDALLAASPRNAHYFFVSQETSNATVAARTQAMQERIDALLSTLSDADAAHWRPRLHVVATGAGALQSWLKDALAKQLYTGLCIDRRQRLRGIGSLADVKRPDSKLQAQGKWPFKANLAYVAYEAQYMNAQEDEEARLDAENAKVVTLFSGEVLSEFEEKDVMLPSAQELATYDTLEIEVTSRCPNANKIETGNCGAWDYLAHLYVKALAGADGGADAAPDASADPDAASDADASSDAGPPPAKNLELARFITTYHRESHWVVDATPMLVRLRPGGLRRFRWEFAPPWNKQPTATTLSLRFSKRGKPYRPDALVPLWEGGRFDDQYNASRTPITVPIPPGTKRAEVWTLVTGHGSDANQCGEFCNHQHELTVNGWKTTKGFPAVGKNDGCVAEVARGMTPNQYGTWWYGRGGWCPGQQVSPWVEDVTARVQPGQDATLSYRGLFLGATPPAGGTGDILLRSYLVLYR